MCISDPPAKKARLEQVSEMTIVPPPPPKALNKKIALLRYKKMKKPNFDISSPSQDTVRFYFENHLKMPHICSYMMLDGPTDLSKAVLLLELKRIGKYNQPLRRPNWKDTFKVDHYAQKMSNERDVTTVWKEIKSGVDKELCDESLKSTMTPAQRRMLNQISKAESIKRLKLAYEKAEWTRVKQPSLCFLVRSVVLLSSPMTRKYLVGVMEGREAGAFVWH